MSKVVEYKAEKFAGTVTFSAPLTLFQEVALEESQATYREVINRVGQFGPSSIVKALLPGLLACIEKFDMPGVPEHPTLENWPLRPRAPMVQLVAWLIAETSKLYADSTETEAPNA